MIIHFAHASVVNVAVTVVGGVASVVVWIVGQMIALITYVLIAVANYNDFSSSTAIETGWVVLRDIANMFFIIVFLVIAFGTMLGEDIAPQYHYKKTLVRFIMMAILINFSKTIAGFIIDLGQVLMMTFVNGFSSAAGGNFLEVLQIRNLTSLTTFDSGAALDEAQIVGGLLLAMVVAIISLICMTVLAMILVVRMVTLWLLVVVSPLAFFAYAVPMKSIQGYYDQWWSALIKNVITGPLLAFFIWLSLAVVSNANFTTEINGIAAGATAEETQITLATSGSDETAEGSTVQAGPSGIGTPNIMLSYMIGIALLMGGLVMAQKSGAVGASYAGGADKWLRKQGSGFGKAVQKTVMSPYRGVAWGAKSAAGAVGDKINMAAIKPISSWAAQKGVPIISTFAGAQAGKMRGKMQKMESEMGADIKNATFDEAAGMRKALAKTAFTEKDKVKLNLLNKRLLETMKFEKWDDKKQEIATSALNGVFDRAKETNNPDLFKFVADYKNNRLDFVEAEYTPDSSKSAEENEVLRKTKTREEIGKLIGTMSDVDMNKINDKAFDSSTQGGKLVMEALKERYSTDKEWDSVRKMVGSNKRKLMDEYLASLPESAGKNPNLIADLPKREEMIKNLSNEAIGNLEKEAITKENIKMMMPEQVGVLLKADRVSVDELDATMLRANNGDIAAQIAESGSDKFKTAVREKFGDYYTGTLENRRKSDLETLPPSPNGYGAPTLAASMELLRMGKGINATFNVDINGNFGVEERGGQDMISFTNALRKEKGGDPLLMLSLKREELEGQALEIVLTEASNKDTLRRLVSEAKTEDQKDILEKIIQEVHKKAKGEGGDKEMQKFIEKTRGIRKLLGGKN